MNKTYRHEDKLKSIVSQLANETSFDTMCHMRRSGEPLPAQSSIKSIIDLSRAILFPGFFGKDEMNTYNTEYIIGIKCEKLNTLLITQITAALAMESPCTEETGFERLHRKAVDIALDFIATLPELRRILHTDVCATYHGDPAATSTKEVICSYPGIKAITNYRIAHALLQLGVPILPRMICEMAHSETGIDIHPGATIGEYFAIDHGTGIVIGATAIIGHHVKLYQGVTLGAKVSPTTKTTTLSKAYPDIRLSATTWSSIPTPRYSDASPSATMPSSAVTSGLRRMWEKTRNSYRQKPTTYYD